MVGVNIPLGCCLIQDPDFLKLHSGNLLLLNSVLSVENGCSTGLDAIKWRKEGYISREISLPYEPVSRIYISNI